jgi:YbbR domain-containing protein
VQQPLPSQQVMVVNLGDGLHATVSPETITLTIIGNEQEIEAISPASLQVQVDAAGLEPGTYEIEPTVILPPNMEWTDIEPSAVTLVIASDSATPAGQTEASPTP